ncbi:MAG: phosphatidate cytidylyltransferase [Firmicutes bacterium]|nr:phosphatidate cytidylyltransferase [Bacillota bacterium]
MKTRIITAVAALAVFAGVLLLPDIVFTIALAAVILMMLYECYSATKADAAMKAVGFVSAALLMAAMYFAGVYTAVSFVVPAVVVTILLHMLLVIKKHGKRNYTEILSNGFLTLYIVFAAGCIWLTKEAWGTPTMLLIFICAWSCDTFAYFSGKAFGRHKLIPGVSPNKTVEGAAGGVVGSAVICFLYLLIANKANISAADGMTYLGLIIGVIGGILSQFGDLAASAIKRDTGIKDFGWIFPGHGGFMDRFDSVIFIAPIVYGILYAAASVYAGIA